MQQADKTVPIKQSEFAESESETEIGSATLRPRPDRLQSRRRRKGLLAQLGNITFTAGVLALLTAVAIAYSIKYFLPSFASDRKTLSQQSPATIQPMPVVEVPSAEISPTTETQPTKTNQQVESQSTESTPSQELVSQKLTEQQALLTVEKWLNAKGKVFASPFDQNALKEVATGQFLTKAGQSSQWLQQNRSAYRYGTWKILSSSMKEGNQVTATIAENMELITPQGQDPARSGKKVTKVTYTMQQEEGIWKISQSQTGPAQTESSQTESDQTESSQNEPSPSEKL